MIAHYFVIGAFFLMCLILHCHTQLRLVLADNSLTGTIPSKIALLRRIVIILGGQVPYNYIGSNLEIFLLVCSQ